MSLSSSVSKKKKKELRNFCGLSCLPVLDAVLSLNIEPLSQTDCREKRGKKKKSLREMWMYLSGRPDPDSPTGCTLSGQKCSHVGCLTLTGYFTSCFLSSHADLCSPQANRRITKCDCKVCSRGSEKDAVFCKIRHTQPVCLQFFEANHIFHLR